MPSHSEVTVKEFLKLCDWLLQSWQMRKYLFDENADLELLQAPRHAHFFYRIQETFQESWLHQLAKLHDPAIQGSNINLSIEYIIEFGSWDNEFKNKLSSIKTNMDGLSEPVRTARNKILSHNDLKIILGNNGPLGKFNTGEDKTYFTALIEFCNLVSQQVLNEPFVYDDLVRNDVSGFMSQFKRGQT